MVQLHLHFENSNKFYFEGEKIKIKLEVNLEKSTKVYNIVANFVGASMHVSSDGKQNNMNSKFFTKTPMEIYFDDVLPLFVVANNDASQLSSGSQVFTFDYQLPHSLPSSLEFAHGYVRYMVHVIAELDHEIHRKTEYFTVVSKTDISKDPSSHLQGILWKPETQCFVEALLCKPKTIRAFFQIPKRGYVPGEQVQINAEICNFNSLPVEWVKVALMQHIKHKGSKGFLERREVTNITRGCILPSEGQTWRSEGLLIPALPPTSYPPKRLLRVKYILCFQLKPSWRSNPIELHQKIVIGTVKLMECKDGGSGENQGQGEGDAMYNSECYNGSNLEPCIFGPHSIEEEGKYSMFSPLYPILVTM